MNKKQRLEAKLTELGLDSNEIEEALETLNSQPRTTRFYKIYLTAEQAEFIGEYAEENSIRFELANPLEKQRKYNPRKADQ